MATIVSQQKALAVRQLSTLTVGGTWLATETLTLTINGKDVVITIGNGTTNAQVASTIRDVWKSAIRLDGTGSTTNTSNVGANEFGEFAEVDAEIYSASDTVVRLNSFRAGEPFTLTVAETSTSGTLTLATPQAATGPEFWNNGDNWVGGTAPANGDAFVLANSPVVSGRALGFKHGLPTDLELRTTVSKIYKSFAGWLGLPPINRDNQSKPYPEYRTTYPKFECGAGAGAETPLIEVGVGDGPGSPMLNIEYDAQHADSVFTVRVTDTGTPQPDLTPYALNLATDATSVTNDLYVNKGHVAVGVLEHGKTAKLTNVRTAYQLNQAADVRVLLDQILTASALAVKQNGGEMTFRGTGTMQTWDVNAGTLYWDALAGATTINVHNGTVYPVRSGTVTTYAIGNKGVVNCSRLTDAFTVTNLDMYAGAQFIDDNDLVTVTNGVDLIQCGTEDVVMRRGKNRRFTKGAVS